MQSGAPQLEYQFVWQVDMRMDDRRKSRREARIQEQLNKFRAVRHALSSSLLCATSSLCQYVHPRLMKDALPLLSS